MSTTDDAILKAILAELQPWANELERKLKAEIAAKKLVDTGNLHSSLRVQVVETATDVHTAITFPGYGRIQDMRAMPRKIPAEKSALRRYIAGVGYNSGRTKYGKRWYNTTVWSEIQSLSEQVGYNMQNVIKNEIQKVFQSGTRKVVDTYQDIIKF